MPAYLLCASGLFAYTIPCQVLLTPPFVCSPLQLWFFVFVLTLWFSSWVNLGAIAIALSSVAFCCVAFCYVAFCCVAFSVGLRQGRGRSGVAPKVLMKLQFRCECENCPLQEDADQTCMFCDCPGRKLEPHETTDRQHNVGERRLRLARFIAQTIWSKIDGEAKRARQILFPEIFEFE